VFGDFEKFLGQQVEDLGKRIIELALAEKILKEALKSFNPGLQIAAGIALVAIGAALQTAASKGFEARAAGGPVIKGRPYLIGEKGPELFVPGFSGTIIPNNKLNDKEGLAHIIQGNFPLQSSTQLGNINDFGKMFTKLLGFRAGGGSVIGGGAYVVGEKGPELFVPNTGGTVIPNSAAAGGMVQEVRVTGRIRNREIILGNVRESRLQRNVA
jgi:hypothetical protein